MNFYVFGQIPFFFLYPGENGDIVLSKCLHVVNFLAFSFKISLSLMYIYLIKLFSYYFV